MPVEFLVAYQQLAIAFLEHVRALVELLIAVEQSPFEVLKIDALGATILVDLSLDPDLVLLCLEDEILLLGAGFGDDAVGLLLGGLDAL